MFLIGKIGRGKLIHIIYKRQDLAGKTILTSGCGASHATNRSAPMINVVGTDYREVTCRICKKHLEETK